MRLQSFDGENVAVTRNGNKSHKPTATTTAASEAEAEAGNHQLRFCLSNRRTLSCTPPADGLSLGGIELARHCPNTLPRLVRLVHAAV